MTSPFKITPELLADASSQCTQKAETIEGQLSTLRTYVYGLDEVWKGVAKDTFLALMNDYDVYARMLHDALTDIASGLQGNMVNYVDAEAANISQLQPIAGDVMPGQSGFELPPARF